MTDRCRICHRILKDADAIARGMGSKCALRNGYHKARKLRSARAQALFNLKDQTLGVPLFPAEGEEA